MKTKSKVKRIYRAAPGAMFNDKTAQKIGRELERIGDVVTPQQVVAASRREGSVLNRFIEWDDNKAAASHRLHQARLIINHLNVVVVIEGEQQQVRAFYHQPVVVGGTEEKPETQKRYIHISVAEREPQLARDIVADAMEELKAWKRRYEKLRQHFAPVFEAIDKIPARTRKAS